ncbi:MAG TPA: hypothetical protein VG820_13415 [Fimbriimonadaceae bacterium]|nr:hypothetical protein [Fimbriimonadaceae bacterium]
MRRIIVIVPELLGEPSVLGQKLPGLERIAELGSLFRLQPLPTVETPEALYLGLKPGEGQLRQGPLTIAALGADPPERSTHFHLSLLSFDDGLARVPKQAEATDEEMSLLMKEAEKLNTKLLTIVTGSGLDHGLVWEDLGEQHTMAPSECDGRPVKACLPEGDGETQLRRLIDDSINLLSDLEINQRRIDEELPPLNLLWPWGQGTRCPVPNLALRRGEPALVVSASARLQGLSRLAGYRHVDWREMGVGTNTRLAKMAELALQEPVSILMMDSVASFRARGMFDEAEWFARESDAVLFKPFFEQALTSPTQITVLAPGSPSGLGARYRTRDENENSIPFDERALVEKGLSCSNLWEAVAASF